VLAKIRIIFALITFSDDISTN